jgi:hypothetical protein
VRCGSPCSRGRPPAHPGRCSAGIHPNSQLEVRSKPSRVVVGCASSSAGVARVIARSFLRASAHNMKVIKFVKTKPTEVTPVELSRICVMHESFVGCAASSKVPRRCPLQALQVIKEAGVVSSPALCAGVLDTLPSA